MNKYDFDFKDIVDSAQDVVIVTKAECIGEPGPEIVYVNQAFTDLTGYSAKEAIGRNPRMLQSIETDRATRQKIRQALEKKEPVRAIIRNFTKQAVPYWLDLSVMPLRNGQGVVTHFAAIERDVTEQKLHEHKLDKLSLTDSLTSVLNRRGFENELEKEYSRFVRSGEPYSVLMLDIDHFKSVNDRWGHVTGDAVLKHFALSSKNSLRRHDSFARYGGEEFCAILPSAKVNEALVAAEKLRLIVMQSTSDHDGAAISVTVSIGVAEVAAADASYPAVLHRADQQMYAAKHAGRNCSRG